MLIIGNPENRRVTLFQQALRDLHQAPARCVSYLDILQDKRPLDEILANENCIRIESPGENFQVEQAILALGGLEFSDQLLEDKGRIYYPGIWYQGFKQLMSNIANATENVIWFNHPDDIVTMFDKPLTKANNPVHALPLLPEFDCYENLLVYAKQQQHPRFFIKLNYSSSASGVMAFECNPKTGKAQAKTTIELVRKGTDCYFYNSLKIKQYSDHKNLADIIDFLFQQGAYIEPWIAKAKDDNCVFDLRVLAIEGKRHHSIARLSKSPITNLHLGNQRRAVDELAISEKKWQEIDQLVADVMQKFSSSLYSGLDILLPRDENKSPILLEANAFGDLLPGLLHDNQTTYQAELLSLFNQHPQLMSKAA